MSAPAIRSRHAPAAPAGNARPLPHRKNLRMQGWDFTSPGWYFLTLCTKNMRSVFGTIVNGRMVLNDAGRCADAFWREIPAHFSRAVVDEHVVMPDHVHGLVQLTACREPMEEEEAAACREPMEEEARREAFHRPTACRGAFRRLEAFGKPVAGSISTIMRSYKAAVSLALGERVWHPRFYEVRARDEAARANIRRYILANPANYEVVAQGVEPACVGNKALLAGPKLGFLASRGAASLHGSLPLKPGEAIISGFLSAMERAVFRAGLDRKRPMIWVKPWGLDVATACPATACRGPIEEALAAGRLLIVSPFEVAVEAPSARRAAWCNLYTLAHCDRLAVGHLNPGGMLECILSEADPEKEIVFL